LQESIDHSVNFGNNIMQYSMYSILVACVAMCTVTVHANNDASTLYDVLSKRAITADECKTKYGEAVESLFDRVCEVCHSMFAHEAPNLRLNCR